VKYKLFLLMLTLISTLVSPAFSAEVLIFSGSGMRLPLEELGRNFTAKTGIMVFYDFDGSGRLGSKILAGITPDIFIPGSDKWATRLITEGYIQKCLPVAYHVPVIITPKGRHQIKSLNDLTNGDYKLALGDAKTSAIGQNNQRLFKKLGIRSENMNVVARGIAVKQLVQWVESGAVDAAIVWRVDAVQSRQVEMVELPQKLALEESIPLCRMKAPPHPEAGTRFWTYLLKNGPRIFAEYGFQVIKSK
jgi:molybdate transport system substrate-binding protein